MVGHIGSQIEVGPCGYPPETGTGHILGPGPSLPAGYCHFDDRVPGYPFIFRVPGYPGSRRFFLVFPPYFIATKNEIWVEDSAYYCFKTKQIVRTVLIVVSTPNPPNLAFMGAMVHALTLRRLQFTFSDPLPAGYRKVATMKPWSRLVRVAPRWW